MFFIAFFGSILSLDVTAVGQWMFSRPIVAGSIVGWLLGDIQIGLLIGVLIELLWINVIPIGVSIPPDSTAMTVLSAYWVLPLQNYSELVLALSMGIPAGIAFKKSDIFLRTKFAFWNQKIASKISLKKDPQFLLVTSISILLTFLKSFLFLILFLPLGKWMIQHIGSWKILPSMEFMIPATMILGFTILSELFYRRDRFL